MNARALLPVAGLAAGYAVFMLANPVRSSLRDGARCLARYKQIWALPALFAFAHAVFRLWVRWFEASLPGYPTFIAPWAPWKAPEWPAAAAASWLPATENLAGLFNCLVDTFPLSAVVAVGFLCNRGGYQAALFRALRRRLGWMGSLLLHAGIVTCAAADVVKPTLFGGLPRFNNYLGADALEQIGRSSTGWGSSSNTCFPWGFRFTSSCSASCGCGGCASTSMSCASLRCAGSASS